MKQRLTRQRIVEAAIAIADEHGLDGLSMRSVAGALGVASMASYRHISGRDDLIRAMVESIMLEVPLAPPDSGIDLVERLRSMAHGDWAVFRAHPWLIKVWATPRRRVDMASFNQLEVLLDTMEHAGLSRADSYEIILGVFAITLGIAALTIEDPASKATDAVTLDEWRQHVIAQEGESFERTHPKSARYFAGMTQEVGAEAFSNALETYLAGLAPRLRGESSDRQAG
ncbi:TetR/AcrR family transcriptional regulator [Mycolicibacterium sp. HK-90]|uniref:TetR/AcrR family transcriptional regulator n=1 Tax=Mycolicibacterium sp. HK-90 TaxID=3056937 RepID=UPI002658B883|nr:TetR/AcrR family transcriptional regulator [Mycolicibacterium sp. HK-90]WKG04886.1 TetR/AcrR family transcriptional regulator [Mycolicibacterium sp. HK-90]